MSPSGVCVEALLPSLLQNPALRQLHMRLARLGTSETGALGDPSGKGCTQRGLTPPSSQQVERAVESLLAMLLTS